MDTNVGTLAVACLLVVAVVGPVAAAGAGDAGSQAANESATTAGEQLSGVIGVQGAEVEGDMADRSLSNRLEQARGPNQTAAVVASEYESADERLAELRDRKAALEAARENGSISQGEYRARTATLVAEISVVERLANRTASVAAGLPAAALEARGVDAAAIQRLAGDARNLTGPEVAAIARGIAGNGVGAPAGTPAGERGPPADRGPPANRTDDGDGVSEATEERIETARDRLEEARDALEDAEEDGGAVSAAERRVEDAAAALEAAETAAENGNDARARAKARQATEHAQAAIDRLASAEGTTTAGGY